MKYDQWIEQQAEHIEVDLREAARIGCASQARVYVIPANGAAWGKLMLAIDPPPHALCTLRLPLPYGGITERIAAIPYSNIRNLLWHGCRTMPICGE